MERYSVDMKVVQLLQTGTSARKKCQQEEKVFSFQCFYRCDVLIVTSQK